MTNTTTSTSTQRTASKHVSSFTKNKRKFSKKAPKPGEPGYMTPTQLRNARKRRAKQIKSTVKNDVAQPATRKKVMDPSSQYLANPTAAPIVRTAKSYFKFLNQDFDVHIGPTEGWRTVSKLAVRPNAQGGVSIGLFAPQSHDLIPIPECKAHHPSINNAVAVLERICHSMGVKPFDEATGQGHLRHVAMNVERISGNVQMTLIWNSVQYEEKDIVENGDKKMLDALTKAIISCGCGMSNNKKRRRRGRKGNDDEAQKETRDGEEAPKQELQLHSLWIHFNAAWKHANAIFDIVGGTWQHVYGPKCIEETLDVGVNEKQSPSLQFPPNVFRQANLDAFASIVKRIRSTIATKYLMVGKKKPTCLELYGGVGTIGLNISDLTSSLTSSDENPFNKECFVAAASKADIQNVEYESKNATTMMHMMEHCQVLVVDPPRKGLDEEVLAALSSSKRPELLIYVSCGFEAFQRDCNALLKSASWQLDHAEGYLLFPGSDAIETLAVFSRSTN